MKVKGYECRVDKLRDIKPLNISTAEEKYIIWSDWLAKGIMFSLKES